MESSADDAAAVDDGESDRAVDESPDPEDSAGDDGDSEDAGDAGTDEPATDDAGDVGAVDEVAVDVAEPSASRWQRLRGMSRGTALRAAAIAVLALVLAGSGYEGWLLYRHHQRDTAASQALEAAQKFALALTTVDPNAIDKNFADVLDGTTGDFKDMYTQASEQLRQELIANKAEAHGTVIDAAVKSVNADYDQVEVVLFIDQSVSNAASKGPQLDRSRVLMTMDKVHGRWLASKLEMP